MRHAWILTGKEASERGLVPGLKLCFLLLSLRRWPPALCQSVPLLLESLKPGRRSSFERPWIDGTLCQLSLGNGLSPWLLLAFALAGLLSLPPGAPLLVQTQPLLSTWPDQVSWMPPLPTWPCWGRTPSATSSIQLSGLLVMGKAGCFLDSKYPN